MTIDTPTDIVILTALAKERDAVLRMLPNPLLEFAERAGDDWETLADVFQIDRLSRQKFTKGREIQ